MTGRFTVNLTKVAPFCPSCGAPRTVSTWRHRGTVIEWECDPYRCVIARTLLLAAGPKPRTFEHLPADDRDQVRRPLWARPA